MYQTKKTSPSYVFFLLLLFSAGCQSNDNAEVVPQNPNSKDIARFEKAIVAAEAHRNFIKGLDPKIKKLRATEGYTDQDLKDTIKSAFIDAELPAFMKTNEFFDQIYPGSTVEWESSYSEFSPDFIPDLMNALDIASNSEDLKGRLLLLLSKYAKDKNYDHYIAVCAVALDSYKYWTSNAEQLRGRMGEVANIVKADALGATKTIQAAAIYALFCGGPMISGTAIAIGAGVSSVYAAMR